jgi:hypothetical protein
MMRVWSFYDPSTGHFLDRKYRSTADEHLAENTPAGSMAIEGDYDHLSQKVQVGIDVQDDDGAFRPSIVDYQPPQTSRDHEWDADIKRWKLTASAAETQRQRAAAKMGIRDIEISQGRASRELLLEIADKLGITGAAVDRLSAIDVEASALRPLLK